MATQASKPKAKARKAPARKAAAKKATAKKATVKKTAAKSAPKRARAAEPTFTVKAQENARNVFLAGLGFYGKAFEEAQSQFEDAQSRMKERREKAEDMFNDLVKRGEKVESTAKKRIKGFELPELKLGDREEIRKELQARMDKARDSFESLRDVITPKAA